MCGFSITKRKITNLLSHRGLKEEIVEFNGWNVVFNSLPLSTNGTGINQPILLEGRLLVFNGEIFNYKDLNPRSKSDVHYLISVLSECKYDPIQFYKRSGAWDGFWSLCLIDKKGTLWFFTDKLGKKQLYHNNNGISSEIKPILDSFNYLDYSEKFFGTSMTNFSSVERSLPGNLYKYSLEDYRADRVPFIKAIREDSNKNLYDLIDGNVKRRLENKIDGVSILLSSGLDSNIVLHHALKYCKELEIVSMESEESEEVLKICKGYGITPVFVKQEFKKEDLTDAVLHYEYSLDYGSLMPNYLLFKNCKNHCVLTGDGADEIFAGYKRCVDGSTWMFDVYMELPYYHNIRIDRMSMRWTKEARSPLMGINLVDHASKLPAKLLNNKLALRKTYADKLPSFIVTSEKKPLRYKNDKELNRSLIKEEHKNIFNK